jgi:hypothetical protein
MQFVALGLAVGYICNDDVTVVLEVASAFVLASVKSISKRVSCWRQKPQIVVPSLDTTFASMEPEPEDLKES